MILAGDEEWNGLLDWLRSHALADHRIAAADIEGINLASEPDEVVRIVDAAQARQRQEARQMPRRRA